MAVQEAPQQNANDFTISSSDAVRLTWGLMECVLHDMFFAQSLMTATAEEIEALRSIIRNANRLRSTPMDEFQRKIHRGIKLTDKALRRQPHQNNNPSQRYRRTFKLARTDDDPSVKT